MPSLLSVGAVALACVGSVSAKQWQLADTFDATNFFDKFNFFTDQDPNWGQVVYQSKAKANELGIAKYTDNQVYLGVDNTNVLDVKTGRPSVRLHSASSYKHGLFIARFSHLPEPKCGSWPAFWTLGNTWPDDGEIDIIEGWNLQSYNAPALHTGSSSKYGQCKLDGSGQTATLTTGNCDNTYQGNGQFLNQGCAVSDTSSPYGTADGGVYALEWTEDFVKIFAWKWANVPSNIDSANPNTDSWGTPSVYLKNDNCDIDKHFNQQTLVINIAFCGNPVGTDEFWKRECKASTGYATCNEYVSAKPGDFKNTYFQIQDIRYFKEGSSQASSSSSAVVSSASTSAVSSATSAVTSGSVSTTAFDSTTTGAVSTGIRFSNSSIPATGTQTGSGSDSGASLTTSVVYTTKVSTITSCAPTVTNCPVGKVVTETVALYTTVCPVSGQATQTQATKTGSSGSGSSTGSGSGPVTKTLTNVYTITSCAPSVTNCPARLSTQYITTTVPGPKGVTGTAFVPKPSGGSGSGSGPSSGSSGAKSTGFWPAPAPSGSNGGNGGNGGNKTPVATPVATPGTGSGSCSGAGCKGSSGSGSGSGSCSGAGCKGGFTAVATPTPAASTTKSAPGGSSTNKVVTGSATKMGASLALVLGAAAAMMI